MKNSENDKPFWKNGLKFACTSCGHCCRHEPGYVFLTPGDLTDLAELKDMSEVEFADKYCRTVDLGIVTRLSLLETAEHDCLFWDQGCTVYKARPQQCRTYPFWPANLGSKEDWERESQECPGMNQGKKYSARKISAILKKREREILISPTR